MKSRFTTEAVISAYLETGSVWKAGRKLGLAGQTVHGRLRSIGHPISSRWSDEEEARLNELVGQATIGQIASELGRSYASIACKVNEIGGGTRHGNRLKRKIPRGAGFDKASVLKYIKEIDKSKQPISKWARQRGMHVDVLVRAIEMHSPEWWIEYRGRSSDLSEASCLNCGSKFYPSSAKQRYCTRLCGERHRIDKNYFGGKRKGTIGLSEGVCQCCGRQPKRGLSSHHIFGKENDPENDHLIAICPGCHNLVTLLGNMSFGEQQWESLMSLAWLRRHGRDPKYENHVLHVCVDIDVYEDVHDKDEDPQPQL